MRILSPKLDVPLSSPQLPSPIMFRSAQVPAGGIYPQHQHAGGLALGEGEIVLDATGKKSGRGVYVCPDPECLRKARKSRGLERALETTIPAEVYDGLEARMGE